MCKIGLLQTLTVFLFSRITPSGVRTGYVRIEKSLCGKAFSALKISQKIFLFYCILRILMIFSKMSVCNVSYIWVRSSRRVLAKWEDFCEKLNFSFRFELCHFEFEWVTLERKTVMEICFLEIKIE